ncbi:MAG TPA: tetratricopeptide repeat protein [Candidatus Acidoferrales bacterium]|jgi:tetratricopeptide (TPR) repeat protein|nr:tetratricopeptide repeat protein [Candidatus Acidoferrales bacterium]
MRAMSNVFLRMVFSCLVSGLVVITAAGQSDVSKQSGTGDEIKARELLNRGVLAYRNARFDDAIEDFKQAKELDPDLLNARLFLATAYATQYIPGAPSDENIRQGQQAIQEFKEVLDADPKNLTAIDGIGSMLYQMGGTPYDPEKLEESKDYNRKHIALKPEDPEPYYWIGLIDWSLAFRGNRQLRAEFNSSARHVLKDESPLPPALRAQFDEEYGATIAEGMESLKKPSSCTLTTMMRWLISTFFTGKRQTRKQAAMLAPTT